MADNVTADPGAAGAVFATDDIGSVHYPITKITIGALDSQTLLSGGNGTVDAGTVRVTVASDSTGVLTVDNGGTFATQATLQAGTAEIGKLAAGVAEIGNVKNAGTFAVQIDAAAVTSLALIDDAVSGAGFNITQMNGVNLSMGNGASGTGVQRVTIASDTTGVLSIDDNGGSLTVDGTVTADAGTGTFTVTDNGSFTLAANSGVDIGDVDVLSVIPGTGATNLGKAIDTASGSTDTGVASLAIRDDTLTTLTPIDGDYVPLRVNSTGALHVTGAGGGTQYTVDDAGPTVVTMAGAVRDDALTTLTEVDGDATLLRVSSTGALHVTGGGGGTEYTQDVAHADPATAATFLMARDDVLSTQESLDGDWTLPRANARGAQWVEIDGTNALDVSAATITVAAHAVTNAGTFVVQEDGAALTALQLIDNAVSGAGFNVTQLGGVNVTMGNGASGTGVQRVTIASDTTGVLSVDDNSGSLTVDNAGTFATQVDGAALTALQLIDNAVSGAGFNITQMNGVNLTMGSGVAGTGVQRVSVATDDVVTVDLAGNNDMQGDIAHDAINSGNPFHLGAQAIAHGTNPTAVAAADRTRLYANRAGIPFMIGGHPNVVTKSARNTGAQTDTALVTIGASLKIVVTRVSLTVDNSTTVDVDFEVGFGATTVPTATTGAGVAGMLADFMGVAAGGGITIGDGSGILGVGADGEDLRYSNTVPTTGNCTVTVSYYTIES